MSGKKGMKKYPLGINMGLQLMNHEIMTCAEVGHNQLSHQSAPKILFFLSNFYTQHQALTYNPKIKSCTLH